MQTTSDSSAVGGIQMTEVRSLFISVMCLLKFIFVGVDWEGPPVNHEESRVTVPDTTCLLSTTELLLLNTLIAPCDDFGVSIYLAAREFLCDLQTSDQR